MAPDCAGPSAWPGTRLESGASLLLQLLRGEDVELVSRELGVMAAELSAWRRSSSLPACGSLRHAAS